MEVEGLSECVGVPQPLQCQHETPVPLFLSKTFDLVDDPSAVAGFDHILGRC